MNKATRHDSRARPRSVISTRPDVMPLLKQQVIPVLMKRFQVIAFSVPLFYFVSERRISTTCCHGVVAGARGDREDGRFRCFQELRALV